MSFLLPLALLTFALAAGPIVAHALRRGRATPVPFPGARLVVKRAVTARKQQRLQDRSLLLLRVLLVLGLALLGASPLVSCSRLSLARQGGSSVAVALLIDDSSSMRARQAGESKFRHALRGAEQLLETARSGDAFSVVLAGKPARILTPATTDLSSVREGLGSLSVSDRATDLPAALHLAESTLEGLPQEDRQVVVLSDLATEKELELPDIARVPLAELTTPLENCAISRASRQEESVVVEVGCTSPAAALERSVELIDDKGTILAKMPLSEVVTLAPKGGPAPRSATVRLTPARSDRDDQIPEDDRSHLLPSGGGLVVGVRADEDRSGLRTSSSTVLDTALSALGTKARVQPLTLIPSRAADLATYAAILIDDPPGFTPETAEALEEYAEQGGVIAAFLGPRLKNAPLGSTFRPLLENPPSWSPSGELSVDPRAEQGLGPLTEGWSDLVPTGRAIIGPASSDARVLARFVGGQPLLLERGLGRGLLLVGALPTSLEESDFALRPAFLALLDRVVHQAGVRNGSAATECGTPWELPDDTTVRGPDGAVEVRHVGGNVLVEPDVAGRYLLRRDGTETERYAVINPQENLLQPRIPVHDEVSRAMTSTSQKTDISREVALGVLLLAAAELAFRLFLGRKRRTRGPLRRELA